MLGRKAVIFGRRVGSELVVVFYSVTSCALLVLRILLLSVLYSGLSLALTVTDGSAGCCGSSHLFVELTPIIYYPITLFRNSFDSSLFGRAIETG